jgi:hypothetical protein
MIRVAFLFLLLCLPARGQTFTSVPYSFTGGTPANASQVMADFNALVTQGNAVAGHIQAQITALGLPFQGGSLMVYFYLPSCPTGWTSVATTNTNNYFVRGLDLGAGNDPVGQEFALGQIELPSILDHSHNVSPFVSSVGLTQLATGSDYAYPVTGVTTQASILTNNPNSGQHGSATYPKNVSLILCSKN